MSGTVKGTVAAVVVLLGAGASALAQERPAREARPETRDSRPGRLETADLDAIGRVADAFEASDVTDEELSGLLGAAIASRGRGRAEPGEAVRRGEPSGAVVEGGSEKRPVASLVERHPAHGCGLLALLHRLVERGLRGRALLEAILREHRGCCLEPWISHRRPQPPRRVEVLHRLRASGLEGRGLVERFHAECGDDLAGPDAGAGPERKPRPAKKRAEDRDAHRGDRGGREGRAEPKKP